MSETLLKKLEKWAVTHEGEYSKVSLKGFFSGDFLVDAWMKGVEEGEKKGKEETMNRFKSIVSKKFESLANSSQMVMDKLVSHGYTLNGVWLKLDPIDLQSIILVDQNEHHTEDFIRAMYEYILDVEKIYSDKNDDLKLLFVDYGSFDESIAISEGFRAFK